MRITHHVLAGTHIDAVRYCREHDLPLPPGIVKINGTEHKVRIYTVAHYDRMRGQRIELQDKVHVAHFGDGLRSDDIFHFWDEWQRVKAVSPGA